MERYLVRFYKHVLGGDHRDHDCPQYAVEIIADDAAAALELAKEQFCREHAVDDWALLADHVAVSEAGFPS